MDAPFPLGSRIAKPDMERLLPHSGTMCLLEEVVGWDDSGILCTATSHASPDNPLREGAVLPLHNGIEYAAQAMAIHGHLCRREQLVRVGYLALVSNVTMYCEHLHQCSGHIQVRAHQQIKDEDSCSYNFTLHHGTELLMQGTALVVFPPAAY